MRKCLNLGRNFWCDVATGTVPLATLVNWDHGDCPSGDNGGKMKESYFSINEEGYSIRCKLYGSGSRTYSRMVIFGHGFGGHKDNRAAEKFSNKLLSKVKDIAVVIFDLPCHGDDARKNLRLDTCNQYLSIVIRYVKEKYEVKELYGNATSFGGYLFLKYIHENGNPFKAVTLRCPAIKMYEVISAVILSEEDKHLLTKGKPVLAGFDRLVKIENDFLEDLKNHDISHNDYKDVADSLLIIQGTKDEIVPPQDVFDFASANDILCIRVENADHRFTEPTKMNEVIKNMIDYYELFLE